MCEYFYSVLRIAHEFCVFDLYQNFLFFISNYHLARNARLQRPNGEIRNILPAILEHIDISHDRFYSGNNGGEKHTSSVKKEVLYSKIIQKESHPEVLR